MPPDMLVRLERVAVRKANLWLVALLEEEVAGCVLLSDNEVSAYMWRWVVYERFRGQGIGGALLEACEQAGVPAGPINDLSEGFADPHVIARKLKLEDGPVPMVRSPMVFSDAAVAPARPAPTLDQDGERIRKGRSG